MVGTYIFAGTAYLWTLIMGVLGLPLLLISVILRRPMLMGFSNLWARGVMVCFRLAGGFVEYRGGENIPVGGAIIASQHQSALETLAFYPYLNSPAYVLKRELYYLPIFGWYLAYSGMIDINRSERIHALRSVLRQAEPILAKGRKLVIFPEGTRVPIGETRPYNKSIYRLYQLGYPIAPVALNSGHIWKKGQFRLHKGVAVFSFLPPLPAGLSADEFMDRLRSDIEAESAKL